MQWEMLTDLSTHKLPGSRNSVADPSLNLQLGDGMCATFVALVESLTCPLHAASTAHFADDGAQTVASNVIGHDVPAHPSCFQNEPGNGTSSEW